MHEGRWPAGQRRAGLSDFGPQACVSAKPQGSGKGRGQEQQQRPAAPPETNSRFSRTSRLHAITCQEEREPGARLKANVDKRRLWLFTC